MPNHVRHKVIFRNEACAALIMRMKMDFDPDVVEGWFDFNKIIPQPEDVDWYQWRKDNWGSKWNAYSFEEFTDEEFLTVRFDTAWSTPEGIWHALAEQYPEAEIHIYYADEDIGSNLGYIHIGEGGIEVDERSETSEIDKLEILNEIDGEGSWIICPKCNRLTSTCDLCYCEEEDN